MKLNRLLNKNAFKVAYIYLIISLIWIFFSDRLLASLIEDYSLLTQFQTYKGWFFVASTALLIYFLVKYEIDQKSTLIKQLKQAQALLKDSEVQAQSLIENAPDAFYLADWNGRILKTNQHACEMLGYTEKELLAKTIMELDANYPSLEQVRSAQSDREVNKAVKVEGNHRHKDGSLIPVEISTCVILVGSEKHIMGFARNISEREESAFKLLKSEKKYRQLFDNALVGMLVTNFNDGKLIDCNKQFLELAGYDSKTQALDEMLIKDHYYHPKDRNIILGQLNENGKIENHEMQFYRRNRELIWVEISYYLDKENNSIEVVIKDIDQRKKAEQALKLSKEKYSRLYDNALVGLAVTSTESSKIIECNQRLANIFGYKTREEAIKNLKTNEMVLDKTLRKNLVQRLKKDGLIEESEIQFIRHDKSKFWGRASFSYNYDTEFVESVIFDITEQKKAELALLESEQRLRNIQANLSKAQQLAHVGNYEYILKTNQLVLSEELYRIYELDESKIPSMEYIESIVHSDDLPAYKKAMKSIAKGNIHDYYSFRIVLPSGRTKHLQSINELHSDELGYPLKIFGTVQDLTWQKEIEENLRKLNTAVEQSGNLIVITTKEGIIEYVNKQFTEVTGYTAEDVIGKKPNILNSGKHSKEFYKNLWTTISSGKIWKSEIQNKKKSGEIYWESALITPVFNAKRKIINYIAIKQDITERKQTEQRIFNTVIETEERERRHFAEDLHDELGPYLSGVKLYIDRILRKELNAEERKEVAKNLDTMIDESITKTREISNRLMPSILTDFGLVKALESYIQKINDTQKLEISFVYPTEDLELTNTEEVVVYRIVIELINNTLKYAKASQIKLEIEYTNDYFIKYSDDGVGYNLDTELDKQSGFGLSNIINRLKSIEASYDFNSKRGKGAEFVLKINHS